MANERSVEVPALYHALAECKLGDVSSFLDVGAHYSHATYAKTVRSMLPRGCRYDGVDILADSQTNDIIDLYITGNILDVDIQPHDFVCCLSTIEHSGISTYKRDNYHDERQKVFERLLSLAKYKLFMTFPFGQKGIVEGQYANVDVVELRNFLLAAVGCLASFDCKFFVSMAPAEDAPWGEVCQSFAETVPLVAANGVQCVAIVTITKALAL